MLYDLSLGEKRFLERINSIVSHEMRNPLNSIACQKLVIQNQVQKIFDLFEDKVAASVEDLYAYLKPILHA